VAPPPPTEAADHGEVLTSGQDLIDSSELAGQTEQLADRGGLVHHITPEDLSVPCVWRKQGREHSDERGLAGSVRPEQSEHSPLGHLQVDTRERNRRAKALNHTLHIDSGTRGVGANHAERPYCARPSLSRR